MGGRLERLFLSHSYCLIELAWLLVDRRSLCSSIMAVRRRTDLRDDIVIVAQGVDPSM